MSEPVAANLDHPLVEIACRLLTPDAEEGWRFDDEAALFLERALLSQKSDPTLPSAVLGLFHVATDLQQTRGAPTAAGRLFALLGAVGPRLFNDGAAPEELYDLIERAQRPPASRALPLNYGDKPPPDTVPAHQLLPKPSPRRKR